MIKQLAWDTFKNTGDINTFLEYKQIENLEKGIKEIEEIQKVTNMNLENK
ncbi:MAG: YqzL family protein [Clostridia bacterium]|nr:YqzL family protein [Clostridia bacterium]